MKKEQKFKRGNLVHIAKDLGSMMSHFENDEDVIIVGSYADQYGGSNTKSYTVMFPDTGCESSWYEEHQLTLIDEGGEHLFKEAKKNRERISKQNTDINKLAPVVFDNVRSTTERTSNRNRQCYGTGKQIAKDDKYINHQFRYDGRIITVSFTLDFFNGC